MPPLRRGQNLDEFTKGASSCRPCRAEYRRERREAAKAANATGNLSRDFLVEVEAHLNDVWGLAAELSDEVSGTEWLPHAEFEAARAAGEPTYRHVEPRLDMARMYELLNWCDDLARLVHSAVAPRPR